MSSSTRPFDPVRKRLPTQGALGRLRQSWPALYWLVIGVGVVAYASVVLTALYALLLLPLVAARALVAVVTGAPLMAAAWLALTLVAAGLLSIAVYVVARWARATTDPD
jgi:hypothetical protein